MANYDYSNLQNNLSKIVLSDAYKRALANKGLNYNDLSLFGFTNSSGLKIKDVFNDMNTALEGGDDGNNANNSISQSRYDQIGSQLYFKTTDGTIIQYNLDNGSITTENANDFINNANSNGFFGTVNGQNNQITTYDRLHFGNNKITAIDYVFGASQSDLNAKYGKIENYQAVAVDVTNTDQMASIIKSASTEDGGYKNLQTIFGTEDGVSTYSGNNPNEMLVTQNNKRYFVKYDPSTGKVTTTEITPNLTDKSSIDNFKSLIGSIRNDFGINSLQEIFAGKNAASSASGFVSGETKDGGKFYVKDNKMYVTNKDGNSFVIDDSNAAMDIHNYSLAGNSVTGDNVSPDNADKIKEISQKASDDLKGDYTFDKVFGADKKGVADKMVDSQDNKTMYTVQSDNTIKKYSLQPASNGTTQVVVENTNYRVNTDGTIVNLTDPAGVNGNKAATATAAADTATTTPSNGKFSIPASAMNTIMQTAGKPATLASITTSAIAYLKNTYGNSSMAVLQALTAGMGLDFNTTNGQGFLATYRDKAVNMIAQNVAKQIMASSTADKLGTEDATKYTGFNMDLKTLNSDDQKALQESVKIDKNLFANDAAYQQDLVNYNNNLFKGETSSTITASNITVSANGGVSVKVNAPDTNVIATAGGAWSATLTGDQMNQVTAIVNGNSSNKQGDIATLLTNWYSGYGYPIRGYAPSLASSLISQIQGKQASAKNETKDGIDLTQTGGLKGIKITWDPMQFEDKNFDYTFVDDENHNGKFDGSSELMGYDRNWDDMKAYDTNGDGVITGDELGKLMILKTDKKTGKTVMVSAKDAGLKSIDLKSHKDENKALNANQTEIGKFQVTMNDGTQEEATQTADSAEYMDDFTKSILKGLC